MERQTNSNIETSGLSLEVRDLNAWYGESHVLHGMDFHINQGEVVTLIGRNGAGKSTTIKSIMGLVPRREGSVKFNGAEIIRATSDKIAWMGIAICPEERGIFSSLSVLENLTLLPIVKPGGATNDEIFDLFPNLRERLSTKSGTRLSGGEQQMLAIARIIRTGSRFLLLDEPTEGLAPIVVEQIGKTILLLKERGYTILLVEQNYDFASAVADRHYVVEEGRVVDHIYADASESTRLRIQQFLSV